MNTCEERNDKSAFIDHCLLSVNKIKKTVKWRFKTLLILPFFLLALFQAWAQHAYAVHSNIIYRFTKYINWPDDKKTGDFVIGVIGDTPLFYELKNFTSNKSVAGQQIVVRKYSTTATSYICHILFLCDDECGSVKRIAAITAGRPTLLVTESEGLSRKGACINFVIVEDRLKLEINKANIERRSLDIASELLDLGIIVN